VNKTFYNIVLETNVWYNVFGDVMNIEKIARNKNGKYKIVFDNKQSLTTYDDVILNNGILFKKQLTSEEFNKINNENNYYDIYNKTIKFISVKMRSLKEITNFLEKKGIDEQDKEKIITKLKEINLINDERFANAYFQDRLHLTSDGPNKIKQELRNNDISDIVIDNICAKLDINFVYDKLDKLIRKKISSNHNKSSYMLKQKIINDMINLGYDKHMILELLEYKVVNDNSIVNNEYSKLRKKLGYKYSGFELENQIILKLKQKGFSNEEINNIEKEDY